ncbi:hypothetical protein EYD45_14865 [Hyunsoonleella flava]|uniref:Lipoprotein n=1 Tax=Hyunsoonleella flava TaxID=2527939 RepID=A0A4Q9FBU2_9FLAO|nr:hypothetical protein [Hyunsoonleella flava]TBN00218.1 hypothetical protein EYD45_14865 [Hyunsoonleella flava]
MMKKSIILLLAIFILSCGNKKDISTSKEENSVELKELKQEIDSIEAVTNEIKNTEDSIDASVKKLDEMLNELEN